MRALLNALDLTGRDIAETRVVVNGAGAAGIACLELAKSIGIRNENALLCDRKGVIHKDRTASTNGSRRTRPRRICAPSNRR